MVKGQINGALRNFFKQDIQEENSFMGKANEGKIKKNRKSGKNFKIFFQRTVSSLSRFPSEYVNAADFDKD